MDVVMKIHMGTHLLSLPHRKGMSQASSPRSSLLSQQGCSNPDAFTNYIGQVHLLPRCKGMGAEGSTWTIESLPHLKALTLGYFFKHCTGQNKWNSLLWAPPLPEASACSLQTLTGRRRCARKARNGVRFSALPPTGSEKVKSHLNSLGPVSSSIR